VSRRTAATIERGRRHEPIEDPSTPGTCLTCRRPLGNKNDMHGPADPAIAAEEARRLGERNTDE